MIEKILVVDDAKFMRKVLTDILSDHYEVVGEAENGKIAVEKVKELDPDLVTLDVVMPEMNGFEALAQIKSMDSPPLVVMSTSVDQNEKIQIAKKIGADGYITKPFKEGKVLDTIEKLKKEKEVGEEKIEEPEEDPLEALEKLEEEIEEELGMA